MSRPCYLKLGQRVYAHLHTDVMPRLELELVVHGTADALAVEAGTTNNEAVRCE